MKWIGKLKVKLTGLTDAITRFPLTTLFLLGASMINAYTISTEKGISKFLLTFLFGAFLSAVAQVGYERFFSKLASRLFLMAVVVLITAGYYLIIMSAPKLSMEIEIRTAVALFALVIAFIWLPVIKSKITFNKSFMIAFKSIFNSLFFSGVIFAGISIIITAINQLIFAIDDTAYPHTANIVFVIFSPMYFLSLIPVYLRTEDEHKESMIQHKENIKKAANPPKFLEILISFIMIPLIAVFTLILVIYIIQNIGGEFWTDNLLEPMLVSYAITVILVYILASEIENKFTVIFRKISPKVLVPIVLFQISSSILSLADIGVTHTRYYVILFGIFAAASGILLSFLPVRKNGIIAPILIVFAMISIIPPSDAFTLSKNSQINRLEEALLRNEMFENNKITPKESIPDEDKEKISNAINYLNMMSYTNELSYLPKDFNTYEDFRNTFGFDEYKDPEKFNFDKYTYIYVKQPTPINITGHDFFIQMDLSLTNNNGDVLIEIEKSGSSYSLIKEVSDNKVDIKLLNENKEVILVFKTSEVFDKFSDYHGENFISAEEATFSQENEKAKITIFVQSLDIQKETSPPFIGAMAYLFVQIK